MLASLSLRNMKRQLSEYKIYWLSLIGVVALMYAFNSLIVSPTMQQLFSLFAESGNSDIGVIATLFSIVIVFALGWFVSYMMDFILQRRSKEISTYMILGVEKSDICKMIFKENTLFGLLALIVGFGFGIYFGTRSLSWNGIQFLSHFLRSKEKSSNRNTGRRALSMPGTPHCQG